MAFLSFRDVSFRYGDHVLFEHLDFDFPSTGLFVLLGSSGCGKTTFLSLCASTLVPSAGRIEKGRSFSFSFVLQSALLLPYLDARDNVALSFLMKGAPRDEGRERADRLLKAVGLPPIGAKDVRTLSGGERMRVAIARALASDATCLLLDEPTGQLDEKASRSIYVLLQELARDRLVLLVTHDEIGTEGLDATFLKLLDGKMVLLKGGRRDTAAGKEPVGGKEGKGCLRLRESVFLLRSFLSRRRKRFVLSAAFLSLCLALFYVGLNVRLSLQDGLDRWTATYFDSAMVSICEKEVVATSAYLHLERQQAPDAKTCLQLGLTEVFPSFSYFLPESQKWTIEGTEESTLFLPVLHQDASKIQNGRVAGRGEVVVNSLFLKAFHLGEGDALGTEAVLSHSAIVSSPQLESTDLVQIRMRLTIVGIADEKEAFNSPVAYYDYGAMEREMDGIYLENISEERNKPTSLLSLFSVLEEKGDDFRGGKVLAEATDYDALRSRAARLYGEGVVVESRSQDIRSSTDDIVSSLLLVLLLFLFLTLCSSFMLAFLSVYSLYEENIRLLALTRLYPQWKKNQRMLSFGMLFSFFAQTGLLLALWAAIGGCGGLPLLDSLGLPPFFTPFEPFAFLSSLLLGFLFSVLASILPIRRVRKEAIEKELEGED